MLDNVSLFTNNLIHSSRLSIIFHNKLMYDGNAKQSGAQMNYHLLETSRICAANLYESNFHVFYVLLLGSTKALLESVYLYPTSFYKVSIPMVITILYLRIQRFHDLNVPQCTQFLPDKELSMKATESLRRDFIHLDDQMTKIGFSAKKKITIYSVLSAILNLGNIQFRTNNDDDSCFIEIESRDFLQKAAILLNVDEFQLEDALTIHTIKVDIQTIK